MLINFYYKLFFWNLEPNFIYVTAYLNVDITKSVLVYFIYDTLRPTVCMLNNNHMTHIPVCWKFSVCLFIGNTLWISDSCCKGIRGSWSLLHICTIWWDQRLHFQLQPFTSKFLQPMWRTGHCSWMLNGCLKDHNLWQWWSKRWYNVYYFRGKW